MKKSFSLMFMMLIFSVISVFISSCGGTGGGENSTLSIPGSRYRAIVSQAGDPVVYQILEFKTNGEFVMISLNPDEQPMELMKGTYVVKSDKIYCTVTWADNMSQDMIGKTYEVTIIENGKKIKLDEFVMERM